MNTSSNNDSSNVTIPHNRPVSLHSKTVGHGQKPLFSTSRKLCILTMVMMFAYSIRSGQLLLSLPWTKPYVYEPHKVLYSIDIKNREMFIIGDLHGCLDELEKLLELARIEVKNKDLLPIFTGDLATKGPHSIMTIRELRNSDIYSVRGEDDDAIIEHYTRWQKNENYNIPKKLRWIKDLNAADIFYLKNLPYTIWIPDKNSIIVHAGIIPGVPYDQHNFTDFMTLKNFKTVDSQLVPAKYPDGKPWASLWPSKEYIYFGHDAARGLQKYRYVTGLDTGCVYGKNLTGIFLNNKKILQVKATRAYVDPNDLSS